MKACFAFFVVLLAVFPCHGEVRLPAFFSDHMVLQQQMKIPVWGWANPGEPISISLGTNTGATVAGSDGKWRIDLAPLRASQNPLKLEVVGKNKIIINDVLIGEVWICSGQSNMDRQLAPRPGQKPINDWEKERDAADLPLIRWFKGGGAKMEIPALDLRGKWEICSTSTVLNFTAVGYFFARDLHRAIKVPIGIINVSMGGTAAEAWTSRETQMADPLLNVTIERFDKSVRDFPSRLGEYQKNEPDLLTKYQSDVDAALLAGKPKPPPPAPPRDPRQISTPPGSLFNGMIAPLIPYGIRGVAWYQGESNTNNAASYQKLFPAMIGSWRKSWGEGDFPFLFVQVAPFQFTSPFIREAQFLTLKKSPNTAMVVTTDVGDVADIHPSNKRPVGERLASAARVLAYQEKIEYSGPLMDSVTISGGQATVSFTHTGSGLTAKGGELRGFEIADAERQYYPANAVISGKNIIVSSDHVPQPRYVRYGWANFPEVNLFNQEGFPASPFRTDEGPAPAVPDDSHSKRFAPWYKQCEDRVAAIKGKPCDIIFIGDSIIQNFDDKNWGNPIWQKYYASRNALNFGVGGDTTANVLWRLNSMDIRVLHPKVAVILIGTENVDDPPEIATGIKAVISRTLSLYPAAKIILVSILPNARAREKMEEVNQTIQKFGDNQSIFYFDLASELTPVGDNWKGLSADHLHPDTNGYEFWAEKMEPLLKELLEK